MALRDDTCASRYVRLVPVSVLPRGLVAAALGCGLLAIALPPLLPGSNARPRQGVVHYPAEFHGDPVR